LITKQIAKYNIQLYYSQIGLFELAIKITEFSLLVMMQKHQLSYHNSMIWQGHVHMKVALEKISGLASLWILDNS